MANSSVGAAIPRELETSVVPTHLLQPGDVLLIEPVRFNSDVRIPADQQILIDGSIDLGGFGRVVVAGLTLEMAENLIERTIVDAGEERTQVNVRLLEPSNRFYVLGEVNSPGSYPLDGNETVLDGLLAAGGLTSSAAQCKILLARPTLPASCRITLPICYREITQLGDTTTNYQLQPGDRIFVASRSWCEELMFWNATKSCARCGNCQSACVSPEVVAYSSPMAATQASASESNAIAQTWDAAAITQAVDDADSSNVISTQPAVADVQQQATEPIRLPAAGDGELEFGPTIDSEKSNTNQNETDQRASERFEPLWIKPATELSSTTQQPSQ